MIRVAIDDITEEHIRALVTDQVEEGQTLDFKRDMPGDDKESRKRFFEDVCSLANTKGGDLVYGIDEVDGFASRVVPHPIEADKLILGLTSALNDGVEPRLHGVRIHSVDIGGEGSVLVVRVSRSFTGLHRTKHDQHFRIRASRSNAVLDVPGIVNRVAEFLGRQDQVTDFFARRYAAIAADEYPVRLSEGPRVVLHIVPTRDLFSPEGVDLAPIVSGGCTVMPSTRSHMKVHTFDGPVYFSGLEPKSHRVYSTTLVHRNGIVEATHSVELLPSPESGAESRSFYFEEVEGPCLGFLKGALEDLVNRLEVGWPVTVRIALMGHRGYQAYPLEMRRSGGFAMPKIHVHSGVLQLPEVLFEGPEQGIEASMRPTFDRLWQSWGYERAHSFKMRGSTLLWNGEPVDGHVSRR